MTGHSEGDLLEQLARSKIFEDYRKAFTAATGLPLALRAPDDWQPAHRGQPGENPFCALMAKNSKACAACLDVQGKLSEAEEGTPKTVTCFAGLADTGVPVKLGDSFAILQTGQVLLEAPTSTGFARTSRQLIDWGRQTDLSKMEDAWFHSKVLNQAQYQAMVRLLSIFAQHLSIVGNQIAVQQRNAEPPAVQKARQFITEHQTEDLSLGMVAKAVNTSSYYFCKLFKKATGLTFTEYLSRVRIERAKNLLLNPNARVSEVAFDTGFQSLTHFNRVFRRIVGESPTEYRRRISMVV
jgi:AraC-like DNA-binding protein/ligand-binding sensor protein